jgi:hypothetical protein
MNAFASVQCTALHNFFSPLGFLLNGKEEFSVNMFTLFVSLLTRALCLRAQLPESLMLGTEHRILCIQFGSNKPAPGAAAA